jgi:hypothetical protein
MYASYVREIKEVIISEACIILGSFDGNNILRTISISDDPLQDV